MDHDHLTSDPADADDDLGAVLYLFTLLATELLLGSPPAAGHSAAQGAAAEERPVPGPCNRGESGDRYRPRPDAEQREFAQAVLRVVSALAHLGATARAHTATGSPTWTHPYPAPATSPRPGPRQGREAADRRWRRWLIAAAVVGALTIFCRPRRFPRCGNPHR